MSRLVCGFLAVLCILWVILPDPVPVVVDDLLAAAAGQLACGVDEAVHGAAEQVADQRADCAARHPAQKTADPTYRTHSRLALSGQR